MGKGRWLLWMVLGVAGLAPGALAQERAPRARARIARAEWAGAWLVEGTTERRYLGEGPDGLSFELTVPSLDGSSVWDFELRGAARGAKAQLEGTVRIGFGRQPSRLEAARAGEDALEVVLTAGAEVTRRERWVRPGAATVAARVVAGAAVTPDGVLLRTVNEEAPLELDVVTGGRPQALLLSIAPIDTGSDPRHGEWVVWQPLRARFVDPANDMIGKDSSAPSPVSDGPFVDEEQVPVGTHRVTWDGRDRIDGEPLRPGSYRVTVGSLDAPIGPASGEADCAPVVLTLHVLPSEFEELDDEPAFEAAPVVVEVKRPKAGGFVRRPGK